MRGAQSLFVPGDLDGFFGLAIDNLVQFLLVLALCTDVLGFPSSLILGRVLPGAALSVLVGNAFYAWQAQRLSARTGRRDVTALPYGINTVSLFAYVFLVMLPVKMAAVEQGMPENQAAHVAWQVGLGACLVSGLLELGIAAQAFQATPRAHAPAVAIGLFPSIAAWGTVVVTQTLGAASIVAGQRDLASQVLEQPAAFVKAGLHLPGLAALSQGFMLTCVVWAAASMMLIERRFVPAAGWMGVGAVLAFFGFVHAGELGPSGHEFHIGWAAGWRWSVGYLLCAAFFALLHIWMRQLNGTWSRTTDRR